MPGLLLVPLAMVVFVAGAQARPSAPGTTADDVRELGRSIEQIHPNPFRSVSQTTLRVGGGRARTAGAEPLPQRAARRCAPAHRAPRPAERAHGALPGRSVAYSREPSVPASPLRLRRRALRRGRRGRVARPQSSRRDRRNAGREGPRSRRAARAARQRLEPPRPRAAFRADRRGARRPRDQPTATRRPSRSPARMGSSSTSRSRLSGPRGTSRSSRTRCSATTRRSSRVQRSRCTWQAAPSPCGCERSRVGRRSTWATTRSGRRLRAFCERSGASRVRRARSA